MKLLIKTACLVVTWLSLSMGTAQAEIILTIDHKLANPGETVLVGVYAASNIGDIISGFNLPLDFNVDGFADVLRTMASVTCQQDLRLTPSRCAT